VVVEKPMALCVEDCDEMNEAAVRHNIKVLAGHSHSFDAPIRKMQQVITSGELGEVVMINSWNYNDYNPRPWPSAEVKATHGPLFAQGPHQIDIVRQLGGGLVKSLRASMFPDETRSC